MKQRWPIALAGSFFAAALLIGVTLAIYSTPAAVYRGKTARQWLRVMAAPKSQADTNKAWEAFYQMGTNAFPDLLATLKSDGSHWDKLNRWVYPRLPSALRTRWPRLYIPLQQEDLWSAVVIVLPNEKGAKSLLPELARMAENKNLGSRSYTLNLLAGMAGPEDQECVPALIQGLGENDFALRHLVFNGLQHIGPGAKAAVPALTATLQDPKVDVRVLAAWTLWKIDRQTNVVTPVLKEALAQRQPFYMQNSVPGYLAEIDPADTSVIPLLVQQAQSASVATRFSTIMALEKYGSAAKAAVPILIQQIENSPPDQRARVLAALKRIDPETAAKYEHP